MQGRRRCAGRGGMGAEGDLVRMTAGIRNLLWAQGASQAVPVDVLFGAVAVRAALCAPAAAFSRAFREA